MKRLNGMDAMLLYSETPNLHTHTLKVAVIDTSEFDGDFGFEVFRQTIARRLHLLDPLRYRLVDIPWRLHHPMWMQDCPVDLDYHLRRVRVPAPGGRRELDAVIGQIASTPLDRSRPLWEFHFAEGLAADRFALIGKVHHTLADGVASANLLARLMDLVDAPQDERDEPLQACEEPSPGDLLWEAQRDHFQNIAELPGLISDIARGVVRLRRRSKERRKVADLAKPFNAPPTFLNHVVSPVRTFATATLSLAEVKETAKHLGVTFNDVVLAVAAGGLRELMLRYDGHADRPILATVPVSTDRSTERITGNEIGGMMVSLPVHMPDPMERVKLTSVASTRAKETNDLLGPTLQGRLLEYLPPPLAPALFKAQAKRADHNRLMNVAISNVPGPRQRGHIGGAPVSEIYSVGVLSAGSAFNMTVWSYVDQLDIAVLSDDRTFAEPHESTDAMVHAFDELRQACGLPAATTVDTALPPA
ncbi:WS/DGAT/MGAT family O-acyltransferase [Mycolicibacterium parafortuitum]|uniref:Diacylglycerol O-acyltransferase n=1 Tax=Mycolicibacterium parafortuitum TaxID=39692 RepID=A0A375YQ11_MYCPF|nr:wax ester/triacylglycerol synthase family O-acyltransferase [Mycolicibacterium parafortuitum]ORB28304.1 diacylglycerol O-acyltransferase [Mycolicibacterium parafortuitum]SRX83226.1 putative triacylglycerol synthase (diacylglycerol acyltransferase) [Mycobacterium tuberculosis H37Rv] [Mycolicibacterium parafortuitum]